MAAALRPEALGGPTAVAARFLMDEQRAARHQLWGIFMHDGGLASEAGTSKYGMTFGSGRMGPVQ